MTDRPNSLVLSKNLDGVVIARRNARGWFVAWEHGVSSFQSGNIPVLVAIVGLIVVAQLGRLVSAASALAAILAGLLVSAGSVALVLWRLHNAQDKYTLLARVTPQQVIFSNESVLLEEITLVRLDVPRGKMVIERRRDAPVTVLGGLSYPELRWMREVLEVHIFARRDRLGAAVNEAPEIPEALQTLRNRT